MLIFGAPNIVGFDKIVVILKSQDFVVTFSGYTKTI